MIATENRHALPLSMIPAPGSESDLHAILHSVTLLLSEIIGCNCAALVLLNEGGQSARLYLLDLAFGVSNAPIVRDVPIEDAALPGLLNGPKPRYIPDLANELATLPSLIQLTRIEPSSSAHVFPISSTQRRPGILVFIANGPRGYSARDVELMTSATVLISTFLDTALAFAAAESYKQNLARERDRLKLILEINNHTITHLDMDPLFRAASKSLHAFFDNALTGFWLFEEASNHLDLLTLDFPAGVASAKTQRRPFSGKLISPVAGPGSRYLRPTRDRSTSRGNRKASS
jgi:formate hydrogenlyase transcriptional activator